MIARPWRLAILGSWGVVFLVVNAAIRVTHQTLTETQLALQFWWVWLGLIAGLWLTYAWVVWPWRR